MRIGDKAGEAAPSYAKGANGTVLGFSGGGAAAVALTPPGWPIVDLGRSSTPSDTNEHSILNANAATTGLFVPVAVKDFWHIRLAGTFLNNSGTSTYTSRIRVYFGAYPAFDITSAALTSSASARWWKLDLRVVLETVGAAGTGTLRVGGESWGFNAIGGAASGWAQIGTSTQMAIEVAATTGTSNSPALITNAAQDFNVTATHSNATASMTTALTECLVRHYPQNR